MSEHKIEKWLYTFTINKEIEKDVVEDSVINGEKVKITKKVKENVPVRFALKRPNRRLYEQADMFYGVKLSEGIRAGLLTKALLLKRYRNDGGALSDADAKYFYELSSKLAALEEEHQRALINVDKNSDSEKIKKIDIIIQQKMDILKSLQTLESVNQALFAHTAETKAQVALNNWWIIYLSYREKEGEKEGEEEFAEFFPGTSYEEKMNQWDIFEETRESYIVEALARFSLLIGLWNAGAQSKEEFEQGEKDYGSITEEAVKTQTEAPVSETKTEEINPVVGNTGTIEISPTVKA